MKKIYISKALSESKLSINEKTLQENQYLLNEAIKNTGIGTWEYDLHKDDMKWSLATRKFFDVSKDFVPTFDDTMKFHPAASRKLLKDAIEKTITKKVPYNLELPVKTAKKKKLQISIRIIPVLEKSKCTKIIGIFQDVTELHNAHLQIEKSKARFRDLFSKMKNGLAILKYDEESHGFRITDMNNSGLMILQKSREEMLNQPFIKSFADKIASNISDVFHRVYLSGKTEWLQELEYKDEKTDLTLDSRAFLLPNKEVAFEFEDITQKKLAERDLKNSYVEIMALSRRAESLREEERKEIARNLHDDLGQLLTALKMDISWMKNNLPEGNKNFKKRSESAINIINQSISSVQRLSAKLRPLILDNLGLYEAIKAYVDEFESRAKIKTKLKLPADRPVLDSKLQTSVYRIIKEAFTNVARHSSASKVSLIIRKNMNILELEIVDDGIGISEAAIQSSESLGLISMWERVLDWQGHFSISGEKGIGTRIEISLPLKY